MIGQGIKSFIWWFVIFCIYFCALIHLAQGDKYGILSEYRIRQSVGIIYEIIFLNHGSNRNGHYSFAQFVRILVNSIYISFEIAYHTITYPYVCACVMIVQETCLLSWLVHRAKKTKMREWSFFSLPIETGTSLWTKSWRNMVSLSRPKRWIERVPVGEVRLFDSILSISQSCKMVWRKEIKEKKSPNNRPMIKFYSNHLYEWT